MSLPENRHESPTEQIKREREHYNIFLPRDTRGEPEPSPGHCPVHNVRYIDYNNGTGTKEDLRCPVCGYKKPMDVRKEESNEEKIKKKNPTTGKKTFAISQDNRSNRKQKPAGQIEIENELGTEVSSYEEYDV